MNYPQQSLLRLMGYTIVCLIAAVGTLNAEELGAVEGAVWRFKMDPKDKKQQGLYGFFRVNNGVLHQKNPRDPDSESYVVGTETLVPGKGRRGNKRTKLTFTNLSAVSQQKGLNGSRTPHHGIKGTVLMGQDRLGKWQGVFIAEDGFHWKFECERVRE